MRRSGWAQARTEAPLLRKWVCITCGFVFDEALGLPEHGVPAGTRFEDLPEDWLCPECGSGKDYFEVMIE